MSAFAQRITMALDDLVGRTLTWISMHEFLTDLHFDGGFVLRFDGSATYARHGRAVRVPQKERAAVCATRLPAAYREYLWALQNNAIDLTLGARRTITLGDSSPDEVRSRR